MPRRWRSPALEVARGELPRVAPRYMAPTIHRGGAAAIVSTAQAACRPATQWRTAGVKRVQGKLLTYMRHQRRSTGSDAARRLTHAHRHLQVHIDDEGTSAPLPTWRGHDLGPFPIPTDDPTGPRLHVGHARRNGTSASNLRMRTPPRRGWCARVYGPMPARRSPRNAALLFRHLRRMGTRLAFC